MNRKGIELSMNFLVIIILSLVVFGFGVKFIYDIGAQATKLESMTAQQLDERIESLLCESEKVCLGVDTKTMKRGDVAIFGMKIINILDERPFYINITPSPGNVIPTDDIRNTIFYKPDDWRLINLNRNEERNIGIGVEVQKDAVSGTYIFDVVVCYDDTFTNNDPTGRCQDTSTGLNFDVYSFKKFYVEVP